MKHPKHKYSLMKNILNWNVPIERVELCECFALKTTMKQVDAPKYQKS